MKKQGFTLVEIMIVVAIIGLLAAIAIPSFMKARTESQKSACLNNLRQIAGAKEQWGLETKAGSTDTPDMTALVGATLWIKTTPECPGGGAYTMGDLSTEPSCDVEGHAIVAAAPVVP